jgi:hypothetical protein
MITRNHEGFVTPLQGLDALWRHVSQGVALGCPVARFQRAEMGCARTRGSFATPIGCGASQRSCAISRRNQGCPVVRIQRFAAGSLALESVRETRTIPGWQSRKTLALKAQKQDSPGQRPGKTSQKNKP